MKSWVRMSLAAASVLGVLAWGSISVAQDLPVVKGKPVVASVSGEPITLDEFKRELATVRKEKAAGEKIDRSAELDLLKRMINTRLILQEARRMDLDKVPEIKRMVDSFSRVALREELVEKITRDVKADEKEVERLYKASTREWKISAVLFESEEHAKSMEAELKAGKSFAELAKAFMAQGKAKSVEEGVSVKPELIDPQLGIVLPAMAVGSISPVVQTKSGFVVLRLDDVRYSENPAEREKAERIVLTSKRKDAVTAYDEALKKKHAKINREVLNSVDYESRTPGFNALLKDTRVVAEVKGEKPVTVGELTEQLRFQFYHGAERAAADKRLNAKKEQVLEDILHRKLFRKEALSMGLDKTESYRGKVREYEQSLVFGAFINKVIAPEVKLKQDELKAYYDAHLGEYGSPEMIRIKSLVFSNRKGAE
ncbi:MAG: peptidyl-prolyl cis-trans isomerase, partial [Rubrivivax sp.]|nr:peptidyl-prolyl cis-trans isomerase [Rubrivivax sp.]